MLTAPSRARRALRRASQLAEDAALVVAGTLLVGLGAILVVLSVVATLAIPLGLAAVLFAAAWWLVTT